MTHAPERIDGSPTPPQHLPSPSDLKDNSNKAPQGYTLPGVLYYLQTQWRDFERERNEWNIEKADLRVDLFFRVFSKGHNQEGQ